MSEEVQKTNTPMVLGILSLILWLLPIAGLPVSICGVVKSSQQKQQGCLAMSIIGLVLSSINMLLGIAMA